MYVFSTYVFIYLPIHMFGVFWGKFSEENLKANFSFIRVLEDLGYQGTVESKSCWFSYEISLLRTFRLLKPQGCLCLSLTNTFITHVGVHRKCSGSVFIIGDSWRNSFPSHLSPSLYPCWRWVFPWVAQSCSPSSLLMYLTGFNSGFPLVIHLDEILFSVPQLDFIRDAGDLLRQARCVKLLAFGDDFKTRNDVIFSK